MKDLAEQTRGTPDESLVKTLEYLVRKSMGNCAVMKLMPDGKFIVHLIVIDESVRPILSEAGARCLDVAGDMGRAR